MIHSDSLEWLEHCIKSHPKCNEPLGHLSATLPSRLIDVGPPDGSQAPFLYCSRGHRAAYVCLSYSWGKTNSFRTISRNLATFQDMIPLANLPRTLREAVVVTRRLEARYLWVDALCIVQDSSTDWERESVVMANIYERSLFTIAAQGSADADGGLFYPVSGLDRRPCHLKHFDEPLAKINNSVVRPVFGRLHRHAPLIVLKGPPAFMNNLATQRTPEPLDSRAWCLQEGILSPRSFRYGTFELAWTCRTRAACECTPEGVETHYYPTLDLEKESQSALYYSWWQQIVQMYTSRALTYGKDRLPALSGLALEMKHVTQDTYLAGLWKNDLRSGLCWQRPSLSNPSPLNQYRYWPDHRLLTKPLENRAPSWSWASLDGPVEFPFEQEIVLSSAGQRVTVVIRDCRVTYSGLNPAGEVSDGILTLHGKAKWVIFGRFLVEPPMQPNVCLLEWPTSELMGTCSLHISDVSLSYPQLALCVPILESGSILHCLILLLTHDGGDSFRRVGLAGIYNTADKPAESWFDGLDPITVMVI